jgi:hypothetical protein
MFSTVSGVMRLTFWLPIGIFLMIITPFHTEKGKNYQFLRSTGNLTMEEPCPTPVLLLIFNRPEYTREVFGAIRAVRPKYLYIAADGPRPGHEEDIGLCREARSVADQIDWDCEVHTLFRDRNLGCKMGVSSAITWFFDAVTEGIILEDDCVPDPSFFGYCSRLLERYRDDERVMMITGTNHFFNKLEIPESYFFSQWYSVWGWATWRRAWRLYDIRLTDWPKFSKQHYLDDLIPHRVARDYYRGMFQVSYENRVDSWAVPWWYTCIFQNGLVTVPKYNLISNIGEHGHFSDGKQYAKVTRMPTRPVETADMVHPAYVVPNVPLTNATFDFRLQGIKKMQWEIFFRQTTRNLVRHPLRTIQRFFTLIRQRARQSMVNR